MNVRRRHAALLALVAALAAVGAASAGGPVQIVVEAGGNDRFAPDRATIELNTGQFHFVWGPGGSGTNNFHNVRQDDRLFRSGDPKTNDDFGVGPSAGSYHFFCEVHGSRSGGMDGVIRVRPALDGAPAGRPFTVIWASSSNDQSGDAFDVRYKRGDGKWKTWKNDTEKFQAVFGRNDRPERVRSDAVYRFQARSEKASNPSRRSDWSPKLTVST
jgi:plastocyanin